jgi:hypothetical protein
MGWWIRRQRRNVLAYSEADCSLIPRRMTAGAAWFISSRPEFLGTRPGDVVATLANHATQHGWHIEPEQHEEWTASIAILQQQLAREVQVLQSVLSDPSLEEYENVVLEYDMRRRGLRVDCVLLGRGILAVLEFKIDELTKPDSVQVELRIARLVVRPQVARRWRTTRDGLPRPKEAKSENEGTYARLLAG